VRMEAWRQWPLGGRRKPCSMKPVKNRLDSDRPSHGRRLDLDYWRFANGLKLTQIRL
jgi:hypothetical protein